MGDTLPTPKGIQMIAVNAIMALVSTITFGLRVYVRWRLTKWAKEDWAAAVGWFVFLFFCASSISTPFYGAGQHTALIPPTKLPVVLRQWYIGELAYVAGNLGVKLSIALMLLRYSVEQYQKRIIYMVTGVTQVYSAIFLFIFAFQCVPSSFYWTRVLGAKNGRCINPDITVIAGYIYVAVTVLFDWTMALLPWFIVRKMHFDFRTKLMIAAILALGSIASVATLIRIPYVASLASTKDFLHDNVDLANWACVETGLSIIASSAATLRPLFRKSESGNGIPGRLTPRLNTINVTTNQSDSSGSTTKVGATEISEIRCESEP